MSGRWCSLELCSERRGILTMTKQEVNVTADPCANDKALLDSYRHSLRPQAFVCPVWLARNACSPKLPESNIP